MSQIRKLQQEARKLKKARTAAIGEVRELVAKFELSAAEIGAVGEGRNVRGKKRAANTERRTNGASHGSKRHTSRSAKYVGPDGAAWSGRGRRPAWLAETLASGKKKEDFLR